MHPMMIVSAIGTLLLYFASIIFLKSLINVETITASFLGNIILIVSVSWLPLHIVKIIIRCVDPTDYQKVMQKI
jgi:phospholipid-translocating ATPase